jgi:hypothetical protein
LHKAPFEVLIPSNLSNKDGHLMVLFNSLFAHLCRFTVIFMLQLSFQVISGRPCSSNLDKGQGSQVEAIDSPHSKSDTRRGQLFSQAMVDKSAVREILPRSVGVNKPYFIVALAGCSSWLSGRKPEQNDAFGEGCAY